MFISIIQRTQSRAKVHRMITMHAHPRSQTDRQTDGRFVLTDALRTKNIRTCMFKRTHYAHTILTVHEDNSPYMNCKELSPSRTQVSLNNLRTDSPPLTKHYKQ